MRNSFLLSYPSVPSAVHPELARLLERNSTDMAALDRLKKLNDVIAMVNHTVEGKVGPSNGSNPNPDYDAVLRDELKKAGVRLFDENGDLLGEEKPAPAAAPAAPPAAPSATADPDAMQVDAAVTADAPAAAPAPPLPPLASPADPFPHFFSVPESSLASLPSYLSDEVAPLRRHLLSRLTKRLLRCSNLLSSSTQPNSAFTNPPDWYFVPLEPVSEKTKRVMYEPWRGAQLIPSPTYILPPHKSLFAPNSVYDYKEHLNYCMAFLEDQKRDFLHPPSSQFLRDKIVYERLHKAMVDPVASPHEFLSVILEMHQGFLDVRRRTKPVAGDINGMEVYEAEKGELDRIVKKLKDALEKKTNMSKKGWHEHMAEIARKYVEGRGI